MERAPRSPRKKQPPRALARPLPSRESSTVVFDRRECSSHGKAVVYTQVGRAPLVVPGSRLVSGDRDACLPTTAGAPVMSENCPSRTSQERSAAGGAVLRQQRRLADVCLAGDDQKGALTSAQVCQQPVENIALAGLKNRAHGFAAILNASERARPRSGRPRRAPRPRFEGQQLKAYAGRRHPRDVRLVSASSEGRCASPECEPFDVSDRDLRRITAPGGR
jgi:hypothetical protein